MLTLRPEQQMTDPHFGTPLSLGEDDCRHRAENRQ